MSSSALAAVEIEYPSADGKPVAESDFQLNVLVYAREQLRIYFRDVCKRDDVYVAGNLLIYYEQGNRKAVVAPDVFAVMGVPGHDRSSYLLWREGKAPDFVLEITSKTTRDDDQGWKRELYRELGVREYWQYDPTGDYLQPVLQGLALEAGEYAPLPPLERVDGLLALVSEVLGLELHVTAKGLRYYDPEAQQYLLSHGEESAARQAAVASLEWEAAARKAAVASLEWEAAARKAAEAGLEREAAARKAAEARVAELEARLRGRDDGDR